MADTTNTTKVLHRITVTVEMDQGQDPAEVLVPGCDEVGPVYGTDELEQQIREVMDRFAEQSGGYTFRVSVASDGRTFPALDLSEW